MKRPIIAVDFDGTLTIGNTGTIPELKPNMFLIERLRNVRRTADAYIKIVTARGARAGLTLEQKAYAYHTQIAEWLRKYEVPFDMISFNKEYAHVYIDDMAILPMADLHGFESYYTRNKILDTGATIVKQCSTAETEHGWYQLAELMLRHTAITIPKVLFANKDVIITQKFERTRATKFKDLFEVAMRFSTLKAFNTHNFETYVHNIVVPTEANSQVKQAIAMLPMFEHEATFYHGDLSVDNCIIYEYGRALIDPNPKVFGSYITDLGKAMISSYATKLDIDINHHVKFALPFAIAEGLRVAKYRTEFIDVVNRFALDFKDIK